MIGLSDAYQRPEPAFLTGEELADLFRRRDALVAALDASRIPAHRRAALEDRLRDARLDLSAAALRKRIESRADTLTDDPAERAFCMDHLSLSAIYFTLQEHFFPLVRKLARSHAHPAVEARDLWQAGMIGLQTAIRKYRADAPMAFGSYATWAIRNRMKEELRTAIGPVAMPAQAVKSFKALRAAHRDLALDSAAPPEAGRLAAQAGVSRPAAEAYLMSCRQPAPLHDHQAVERRTPCEESGERERTALVEAMICSLPNERDRTILRLSYGIGADRPHTLEEIAGKLGFHSRVNVHHIRARLLRMLRGQYAHLREMIDLPPSGLGENLTAGPDN